MYKCQVCKTCVGPGKARLTHAVMRRALAPARLAFGVNVQGRVITTGEVSGPPRYEIAREIAVCPTCKKKLERGTPAPVFVGRAVEL